MSFITKKGRDALFNQLEELNLEMKGLVLDLADARESGTLEENPQLLTVQEAIDKLNMRISKIKNTINNSQVIDDSDVDLSIVNMLTKVTVLNMVNNKEMTFSIVPETEIDIKSGKISPNSPIGSGLFGKKVGEECLVKTPAGSFNFKVLEISLID